jgi:inosose dehydratase
MRRHHARIPYLHIKDVDGDVLKRVEAEDLTFVAAVKLGVSCEPPTGVVDFLALVDLLRELDFDGPAVVEQDMYPAPFDKPLPIAKRTRAYLREVGMG